MVHTVLIVDDNTSLAYITSCSLRQDIEGLKVIMAGSCEEARTLGVEHRPSVLIADLKLPDGSGLDLIDELSDRFSDLVSILITATPLSGGLKKNLFAMLTKPYDPEALIELVRQALKSGGPVAPRSEATDDLREAESPPGQYDFHHVMNRLSGLLGGIRALRLELHAVADDPSEVRKTIDEYADLLSAMVKDAAEALKRKA